MKYCRTNDRTGDRPSPGGSGAVSLETQLTAPPGTACQAPGEKDIAKRLNVMPSLFEVGFFLNFRFCL